MDLSDIIVRLRNLESRPTLESTINELSESVRLLKEDNEKIKKELEQLNKINLLETRIYNLEIEPKIDINPLNSRVSNLENTDYNDRLTAIDNRLSSVDQFSNTITDLTYRIIEIEKRPNLSEQLSNIDNRITEIEKRPELSQRLSILETIVNNLSES